MTEEPFRETRNVHYVGLVLNLAAAEDMRAQYPHGFDQYTDVMVTFPDGDQRGFTWEAVAKLLSAPADESPEETP